METRLYKVVQAAITKDPKIVVHESDANLHPGFTEEYMDAAGLNRSDLKRLERKGLALRGYSKNVWTAGETVNGHLVENDAFYVGKGHQVRWLLLARGPKNENPELQTLSTGQDQNSAPNSNTPV